MDRLHVPASPPTGREQLLPQLPFCLLVPSNAQFLLPRQGPSGERWCGRGRWRWLLALALLCPVFRGLTPWRIASRRRGCCEQHSLRAASTEPGQDAYISCPPPAAHILRTGLPVPSALGRPPIASAVCSRQHPAVLCIPWAGQHVEKH